MELRSARPEPLLQNLNLNRPQCGAEFSLLTLLTGIIFLILKYQRMSQIVKLTSIIHTCRERGVRVEQNVGNANALAVTSGQFYLNLV